MPVKPEDLVLAGMVAVVCASAVAGLSALLVWRQRAARGAGLVVRLAFSGALTVFLGASLLLGLEAYLRFASDATDSFALTRTTQRWFERHYQRNSWHLRDDTDYTVAKSTSRRRISFVGDSFTAGHGVPDVANRFANRLRETHPDWEIHVLARNGLDTATELRLLERTLDRGYETDEIVLVYCLNDIAELLPEWRKTVERIYDGADGFLVRNSYALNRLYFRLWKARDPEVADYFAIVANAYEGAVWQRQKHLLRRFARLADERGIRFRVVTFPFLHALGPDYAYAAVHERLGRLWGALGVPHLDLLDVYAGMSPDELVVNRFDAHPNERAHALAADAIGAFLERGVRQQEAHPDADPHPGERLELPLPEAL